MEVKSGKDSLPRKCLTKRRVHQTAHPSHADADVRRTVYARTPNVVRMYIVRHTCVHRTTYVLIRAVSGGLSGDLTAV